MTPEVKKMLKIKEELKAINKRIENNLIDTKGRLDRLKQLNNKLRKLA